MARTLRDAVAHAASPWNWRSDVAVAALVVVMCTLPVATLLAGLGRTASGDGARPLVQALPFAALYWLLFSRPAIRAMRTRRSRGASQRP